MARSRSGPVTSPVISTEGCGLKRRRIIASIGLKYEKTTTLWRGSSARISSTISTRASSLVVSHGKPSSRPAALRLEAYSEPRLDSGVSKSSAEIRSRWGWLESIRIASRRLITWPIRLHALVPLGHAVVGEDVEAGATDAERRGPHRWPR